MKSNQATPLKESFSYLNIFTSAEEMETKTNDTPKEYRISEFSYSNKKTECPRSNCKPDYGNHKMLFFFSPLAH